MKTIQYTLPSWTLCSLFNSDNSGLDQYAGDCNLVTFAIDKA